MSVNEIEDHLTMSDGFSLFQRRWEVVGEEAEAIVCIHGWGCHSGFFRSLGQNLAANGVGVYALDLRGFGNSKEEGLPIGDTRDFRRHLQDIDEAVCLVRKKSLGLKIYMLGHSLGGLYTLWYGATHPDALDGIILAAPAIESGFKPPSMRIDAGRSLMPAFAPEKMIDMYEMWPQSLKESEEGQLWHQDPLSTQKFSWRWLGGSMILLDKEALQNASKIKKPTMLIQGEADDLALPIGARKLFENLAVKDKSLLTFPDADHWLYHAIFLQVTGKYSQEKREQVFSTIKDWLETH